MSASAGVGPFKGSFCFNCNKNTANSLQTINNEMYSFNNNTCNVINTETNSNNTLNIVNTEVGGDVTAFNISGKLNATCAINQQISQQATAILDASAKQKNLAVTGLFPFNVGNNTNSSNQVQHIKNNLTSISFNLCNSSNTITNNNDVINIYGSKIGTKGDGNVSAFNITSSKSSQCTLSNTVSQVAYSKATAKSDQSNTTASSFGMIIAIIGVMVIMGIMLKIFNSGSSDEENKDKNTVSKSTVGNNIKNAAVNKIEKEALTALI
jgi:hypothetical protein